MGNSTAALALLNTYCEGLQAIIDAQGQVEVTINGEAYRVLGVAASRPDTLVIQCVGQQDHYIHRVSINAFTHFTVSKLEEVEGL